MSKMKLMVVVIVIGAIAMAGAVIPLALAQAESMTGHSGHMSNMNMEQPKQTGVFSLESIHSKHVPMVVMSIDKAKSALQSGDRRTVLTELNEAREMLVAINKSLATYVKPKFANDHCPIFGTPIAILTKSLRTLSGSTKVRKLPFAALDVLKSGTSSLMLKSKPNWQR
jgi:hypothetical protein